MPKKRPVHSLKRNLYAILRPRPPRPREAKERQLVAEEIGHRIYDLLVEEDDGEAIRLLRRLRSAVRESEALREYLGVRPKGKGGRNPGALSKRTERESWQVYVAVKLCGLSRAEVIRCMRHDKTWIPTSRDYDWVKRRLEFARLIPKVIKDWLLSTRHHDLQGLSPAERKGYGLDLVRDLPPPRESGTV